MTFSEIIIKRMTGLIETANKDSAWEMEAAAEMMKAIHLLNIRATAWRTDLENAPSPCIGWCTPPAGDDVRQIWRHPRDKNQWTSHSITQSVKAWQPLPLIAPLSFSVVGSETERGK